MQCPKLGTASPAFYYAVCNDLVRRILTFRQMTHEIDISNTQRNAAANPCQWVRRGSSGEAEWSNQRKRSYGAHDQFHNARKRRDKAFAQPLQGVTDNKQNRQNKIAYTVDNQIDFRKVW